MKRPIQTLAAVALSALVAGVIAIAQPGPGSSPWSVIHGGTGRATLTNHGVLVGAATAAVTQITVPASGTLFQGNAGADPSWTATPVLGVNGGALGSLSLRGNTSGTVLLRPQAAAGTPTITFGTNSGTPIVTVTSPLAITAATGNAVITGAAGQVLAGASPAFTATPTLGVAGATTGTIAYANTTSGTITVTPPATGALGSSVLTLPIATDTLVGKATTDALTGKTYNGLTVGTTTGTFNLTNGKTFAVSNSLTLAGTDGKTATFNNSLTFAGTDATTMTFPSVSATIPRTVASGAKALATGAISSGTCTTAQTDTATGTATTDVVTATFSADPTATTGYLPGAMLSIVSYPTTNTVNFKVCNNTGSSITPGAVTLNWRVTR